MLIFSELWKVDFGPFGNKLFIYTILGNRIILSHINTSMQDMKIFNCVDNVKHKYLEP